jgi:hypothetical protein
MHVIKHRVNSLNSLLNLEKCYGAEIDVRVHNNKIILHHDAFFDENYQQLLFEDFLNHYKENHNEYLIINLKTEGIENECLSLLDKYKIDKWFFLDMSMPYQVKYSKLAEKKTIKNFNLTNLAVRFSDYEPIEYALSFHGRAGWVWLDSFDRFPLNDNINKLLKKLGYKICLVSPELQNKPNLIESYKTTIRSKNYNISAVCTKYPEIWSDE